MRRIGGLIAALALVVLNAVPAAALTPAGARTNWLPPPTNGNAKGMTGFLWAANDPTPTQGQRQPAYFYTYYGGYGQADGGVEEGWYIGLQKDERGERVVFSAWNAMGAVCSPVSGAVCAPFNHEGSGYSVQIPYAWDAGHTYMLKVAFDPVACHNLNGYIMNDAYQQTFVGAVTIPGNGCPVILANADYRGSFTEQYSNWPVTSCHEAPYTLMYFYPPTWYSSNTAGTLSGGSYSGYGYPQPSSGDCPSYTAPSSIYPPWHEHQLGYWTL